jgi:type III restriction enzyme
LSLRWALWIPAVNTHGVFGRWDFVEIADPWNGQNLLRSYLAARREEVGHSFEYRA